MISKHILLIVNPVSGRMKSKNGLFEMLDELYRGERAVDDGMDTESTVTDTVGENALPLFGRVTSTTLGGDPLPDRHVTVCPTMYRGHAVQLAASASATGVDTVICCGGDGTLSETITGLLSIPEERRPMLGYIPAGSTNDFAASLGLPTTLRAAARMAVAEGVTPIDVGRFMPIDGKHAARNFSYIASFGIFTAASYSTPQSVKNVLGHVAYILQGAKDLANIHPHHAVFDLDDGTRLEGDYIFGAVTNTTSAGGVFKLPAGAVSMSDGRFEVFLVHNPHNLTELNRIATALMSANFAGCPLIEFYHASSVTVTLEHPISWSLDGEEAATGTQVEIQCLPGAVRFKTKVK